MLGTDPIHTVKGPADAGSFDLNNRSVTVKVDVSKLNAVQTRGAINTGTVLMGLRASASAVRATAAGVASVGFSDSTRGGGTFTMGACQP